MQRSAAVIGGGISGLASAFRLSRLGFRVTLIESESFLGGLGTTFPYKDGNLERFYHCILPDDDALIRIIQDLGLGDQHHRDHGALAHAAGKLMRIKLQHALGIEGARQNDIVRLSTYLDARPYRLWADGPLFASAHASNQS